MNKGLLITFEGGEGCGKSTQIRAAYQWLMSQGYGAVVTREPGSTPVGKVIREMLLDPDFEIGREAEVLLYMADRAQHINEVIKPALDLGRIVLCDRYHLSTLAYQCAARGVNEAVVTEIFSVLCMGLTPDLTIWIDTDVETALDRARQGKGDRIERESLEFHQSVHGFFAGIDEDRGYVRVDGNQEIELVSNEVIQAVQQSFTLWAPPGSRRFNRGEA